MAKGGGYLPDYLINLDQINVFVLTSPHVVAFVGTFSIEGKMNILLTVYLVLVSPSEHGMVVIPKPWATVEDCMQAGAEASKRYSANGALIGDRLAYTCTGNADQ